MVGAPQNPCPCLRAPMLFTFVGASKTGPAGPGRGAGPGGSESWASSCTFSPADPWAPLVHEVPCPQEPVWSRRE